MIIYYYYYYREEDFKNLSVLKTNDLVDLILSIL